MDQRKSASALTQSERDQFLEAIIKLKQRPGDKPGISLYDQFVALHGAVMSVSPTGQVSDAINFAHGNIGFLAWHRQYIRAFELALQGEVPHVTLPYWDWSDDVGATTKLFTEDFLSSTSWGLAKPINDGVLRANVPTPEQPAWWPAGAKGFELAAELREGYPGRSLRRGSTEARWPPTPSQIKDLTEFTRSIRGTNVLWAFWLVLEQGHQSIAARTHNAGHRFVGGHMAGSFSPNDPIFWLHHANVDRIWALWQEHQDKQNDAASVEDFWPPATENSPFTGSPAPPGHRLDDEMWPWVGAAGNYRSFSIDASLWAKLPDYSGQPALTVREVLDLDAMGYEYL